MAVSVQMPKQGNTVEECLLVEWKVKEGDKVKTGDVLCAIETDKASFDVESTATGTVLRLLASAGDLVPVLTDIVIIGEPGEKVDAAPAPVDNKPSSPEPEKVPAAPAAAQAPRPAPAQAAPAASAPQGGAKAEAAYPVSPRARKMAEKFGFNVGDMAGTGVGGRVTSRDVQNLIDKGAVPRPTPLAREAMAETGMMAGPGTGIGGMARARDLVAGGKRAERRTFQEVPPEVVPYKGIRKLIGDRMSQSLQEHAQLTLNSSADATAILALRKTLKENAETSGLPNISINDMICWVTAQTLPHFPEANAIFDRANASLTKYTQVNLGVAIDTPRGLMVPVIPDAHRLSLAEIAVTIRQYAEDCRKGSIQPDLLSGGTFTVTNLGSMGVESFTPILNSPQVAILGVNAIVDRAVKAPGGGIVLQPRLGLSLTIDHQVVDGAPGAKLLQAIAKGIENIGGSLALLGAC